MEIARRKARRGIALPAMQVAAAAALIVVLFAMALTTSSASAAGEAAAKEEAGEHQNRPHGSGGENQPEPVERALGLEGLRSRWDAVVSWTKLKVMELRQRRAMESGPDGSKGLNDAVSESVGAAEEAAEKAARTAAEAIDRTVHRAKEKVEEVKKKAAAHNIPASSSLGGDQPTHAEL